MGIWFVADTHFHHSSIAEARGFSSMKEMDELIMENWNSRVHKSDDIYIIGDFAMMDERKTFSALNGRKHLVCGEYDCLTDAAMDMCTDVSWMKDIMINGRRFTMSHLPMRTWIGSTQGAVQLHGHLHGKRKIPGLCYDVGVDGHGFSPYSFDEIMSMVRLDEKRMLDDGLILAGKDGSPFYRQDSCVWADRLMPA